MTTKRLRTFRIVAAAGVSGLAMLSGVAVAQDVAPDQIQSSQQPAVERSAADQDVPNDEIVVTGTILRGAPPVGSNLISIGEERIASTGATTANELLATVPQVSNLFNNVPTARLGVAANQIQVVRPNLRNLASETSSSASTLVLFDGHRIAPVGVTQNAVDPDIMPTIAIERVEVVTDGGSATYGSDAVGGVINFITRKRFDGLKVQGRYGFADNYYQVDGGVMVGKDWGSGSVFAAYNYQHNNPLFGRDRDFIRDVDWSRADLLPRGRSCSPGNVVIANTTNLFALPALTSTTPNACDSSDDTTVVPRSTRHSALLGLHQELADWLTVDIKGFFGQRKSTSMAPFTGNATVTGGSPPVDIGVLFGLPPGIFVLPGTPLNAYYRPVPGQDPTATQNVYFTLAPLLGRNSLHSGSEFKEWGANAEFQAQLTNNWQLRTLFNYSRSASEFHIPALNQTLLNAFGQGTTPATSINFYNPGAGANDLANIRRLIDTEVAARGEEELFNARAIIDGSLFTLPGGQVKLAVGYEFMHDGFRQAVVAADQPIGTLSTTPFAPYSRSIHSVFGEVQVPLVGVDNRMGFIHTLTLAGSVRYDHFSDFGSTTNPKIGVNFKPVAWLGFRGNYSTSFNAPSPVDQLGSLRNTFFGGGLVPFNAFIRPGDAPNVQGLIAIQGSRQGLSPQTAKTYSIGIDLDPPFVQGLHASVNYYNVKFKNIITQPFPGPQIFGLFPDNIVSDVNGVTIAQVTNFLNGSGVPTAPAVLAATLPTCNQVTGRCPIYELIDFRQGNYGRVDIEGLDFAVNYRTNTSFGGIDAIVSGNYTLKRKFQSGPGAVFIDETKAQVLTISGIPTPFNGSSRLQLSASIGADIGRFRTQATLNHSAGYGVVRCDATTAPACTPSATGAATASGLYQDRVGAFNTVNLFFKYDVPGDSLLLRDLEFTLNINNVFDTDPPIFRQIGGTGYANGFTLGRLVQIGISKKF